MSSTGELDPDVGDTRVSLYVWDVTNAEVKELCEQLADLAVKRGYAAESDKLRAIITAEPWQPPESSEELIAQIGEGAGLIVLPDEDGGSA